jgi:cytochrome c oxidase subunit 4
MAEAAHGHAGSRGEAPPEEHVPSLLLNVGIWIALLLLTAATTAVAFVELGPFNIVAAVGIAFTKATLVVLYFMHVRWAARLIPLAAGAGLLWLFLLVGGTLGDYFSRGSLGVPGK